MLENEPEGGDRTGTEPAGDTADVTRSTPVRATRRRTTKAAAAAAAADGATAGDSAPPAAGDLPPGEPEGEPRARRRRKAVVSVASDAGPEEADAAPVEDATPVEPVAKKATRSRRKKTAEPVVVPVEESEPAPGAAAPQLVASAPAQPLDAAVPATEPLATEPSAAEAAQQEAPVTADDEVEPRTRRRRSAAATPPAVLFMAPDPQTPAAVTGRPAVVVPAVPVVPAAAAGDDAGDAATEDEPVRRRRRGRRGAEGEPAEPAAAEPVEPPAADAATSAEEDDDSDDDDDDSPAGRRRRRRGRRGRGRGKGGADDDTDDESESATSDDEEPVDDGGDAEDGESTTRRRRRRRRRGSGDAESGAEDGVPTVVKIREPRRTVDEVQGVTGSTRLEAKRQRRRDGREQRRTRPPILSESEFLARREAVDRDMVVRQRGDRTQIAVLEDGILVEHYVTRASSGTMAGNVYLGKVQNVLPSMEAAFVDVGRGRNAVLYAGEVNWDATGLEGRARSIEQALRSGDSVLVQVTKDPIGHKGARLTSHIALSGRHLVYVPNGNASGISRKLPDTERKRLRDVLKKLVPEGAGVIVRTAAEGASEDELARDVKRLQAQWEDIQAKVGSGGAPTLLYEEPDLVIRVVRDLFNEDFRELIVQGETAYEMVESYLAHVSPDLLPRLRRHAGVADVFADRRIDEQILKGLDRKVFLPSGGHLVIDRTEAMTVVDVNTGKYTGAGGNLEETVTRNNLEAAEEIVRQLRLRDIGGIVVIDFIDMVLESNRELVLRRLTECLGRDRTKHQVTEITSLGLVQMTRKRIAAGLLEAFSETCDCCKGRGVIIHTEPVGDKPRAANGGGSGAGAGAGDKVKAVAAAVAPTSAVVSTSATSGQGRRRGRRAAEVAPEVTVPDEADLPGADGPLDVPVVEAVEQPGDVSPAEPQPTSVSSGPVTGGSSGSSGPVTTGVISVSGLPGAAGLQPVGYDDAGEDETMGYDLSRYESEPMEPVSNGPTRLAGDDDPDLADDGEDSADEDADEVAAEHSAGGRRRVRRGGVRRRTRP
ncbi:Rne/Rng family ribonuclease [Micromonospora sp. LOL_023]|uniref:Rne/Rng family ribonuclease n=1 Tax=Micromonospora sp. LOL_023 TaxID=3345418 RepID=UPI003A8623A3